MWIHQENQRTATNLRTLWGPHDWSGQRCGAGAVVRGGPRLACVLDSPLGSPEPRLPLRPQQCVYLWGLVHGPLGIWLALERPAGGGRLGASVGVPGSGVSEDAFRSCPAQVRAAELYQY